MGPENGQKLNLPIIQSYPKLHSYPGDIYEPLLFKSVTFYVNRHCPLHCCQCSIADGSRKSMSMDHWKEMFEILQDEFGVSFFLCLGTEPLLLGQKFVDLVSWLTEKKIFYAFYTTSPEPLFTKYRQPLLDAGLNNWSSGIDGILGRTVMDSETTKKVRQAMIGLKWMAERGIQTHTSITVHRQNLDHIIDLIEWCQDSIPGVQSAVNFIEWKKDPRFDFFSWPHEMKDYLWLRTDEERQKVKEVMAQIKSISRKPGRIIGLPDSYLDNAHLYYDKLDAFCNWEVGMSIDADGTIRTCGYMRDEALNFNVLELRDPSRKREFTRAWRESVGKCSGCYWNCPPILADERLRDPRSGLHQERWRNEHPVLWTA